MPRTVFTYAGLIMLLLGAFFSSGEAIAGAHHTQDMSSTNQLSQSQWRVAPSFPVVDPNYIYQQLYSLVTRFPGREAGYDNNQPPTVNGHDEFAAAWATEMTHDLDGFGPQVRHDTFPIAGWTGRPAMTPAFNVEVSVPGVTDPAHVVVIGCHYDGEADSTQSANDDGSGCAIELGVAKALGDYWRTHHLYPARTLRFVIFDAEEQGVFGSFHYLNSTVNGDVGNIVAMFNEEQNGIAYPLRYLGKTSNPLLPFDIFLPPLTNNQLYPAQSQLSQTQRDTIANFRALMSQAIAPVFAAFQSLGYQTLTYHGNNGADVSQPVFSPDQVGNIHQADDTLGGSDQIPFTLAGLPSAMFVGNATYYDNSPPPWSYPYDQPQDTVQLMNVFANGTTQQAQALTLALALPGMLTTWMLSQPAVLGQVSWDHLPVAAISDIGLTQPGQALTLDASASYDPSNPGSTLTYAWEFGDSTTASGASVTHTYASSGIYTLTLTVTSSSGVRKVSKTINVTNQPKNYANPYAGFPQNGIPPRNPQVQLPPLNSTLPATTTPAPAQKSADRTQLAIISALIVAVIALVLLVIVLLTMRRANRPKSA